MKFIEELKELKLKKPMLYSVYSNYMCGDTLQELLNSFVAYINECIEYTNKYSEMVEKVVKWITSDGLKDTVKKQLEIWIDNGTFEDIINNEIFGDLSSDVEKCKKEIEQIKINIQNLDTKLDNTINIVDEKLNENIAKVEELINKLEQDVQANMEKVKNDMDELRNLMNKEFGDITSIKAFLKYNIDGIGDQREKFQKLIDDIREGVTGSRVYIPKGTYLFEDTVQNLSDIHLICSPQAKFKKGNYCRGGIFLNGIIDSDYNGRSAGSNIIIEGGIWDSRNTEGWSRAYIGGFALGENIILKNMTFLGLKGFHVTEFSGCKNVKVLNCRFTGTDTSIEGIRNEAEALEISSHTAAGFPFFGHNAAALNIVCENILVEDCIFDNFTVGVGSHGGVHDFWDRDINVNKCTFRNMSYCAITGFKFDGFNVLNNYFYQCDMAVYCRGMLKNIDLDRPSSQTCQYTKIIGNTVINYQDSSNETFCIFGAKKDESDNGLGYSNFVIIKDNIIQRKNGVAIKLRFVRNAIVSDNTVKSGQFIRVANSRDIKVHNNIMEVWQDVAISFSKDGGSYEPSKGCLYIDFSNNHCTFEGDNLVNLSFIFFGKVTDNIFKLNGSGKKIAVNVNSESDNIVVINNVDYASATKVGATYTISSTCETVYTGNNISIGYKDVNNTSNNATERKEMIDIWK